MTVERDGAWIGVDVGKTHHWVRAVDEHGQKLLSLKVLNDAAQILEVISAVRGLTQSRVWGIDILGTPSALLLALLAQAGEPVRYASGRVVAAMSAAYTAKARPTPRTPTSLLRPPASAPTSPWSTPMPTWCGLWAS